MGDQSMGLKADWTLHEHARGQGCILEPSPKAEVQSPGQVEGDPPIGNIAGLIQRVRSGNAQCMEANRPPLSSGLALDAMEFRPAMEGAHQRFQPAWISETVIVRKGDNLPSRTPPPQVTGVRGALISSGSDIANSGYIYSSARACMDNVAGLALQVAGHGPICV